MAGRPRARGTLAVLVAIFMFVGAAGVFMRSGALADEQGRATDASLSLVRDTVAPAVQGRLPQTPEAVSALVAALEPSLNSGDVLRVRIWARDRSLVYSTQSGDLGTTAPTTQITSVLGGNGDFGVVKSAIPDFGSGATAWVVVAPLRDGKTIAGAVEVDRSYAAIEKTANNPWLYVELAGIGAATLFLLVLAASFIPRRRRRADDQWVAVSATPVPANKISASGEPLSEGDGELLRLDQHKLVARVQKAESSRRAMELQLGQLRQQTMSGDLGVAEDKIRELDDERQAIADRAEAAETRVTELEARLVLPSGAQATPMVPEPDLVAAQQGAGAARAEADDLAIRLRDSEAKNRTLENALLDARAQLERTTAQVTELDTQMREDTERTAASDEHEAERAEVPQSANAGENDWLDAVEPRKDDPPIDPTLRERLAATARKKKDHAALETAVERTLHQDEE